MKKYAATILIFILFAISSNAASIRPPLGFSGKLFKGALALYVDIDGTAHFDCTAEPFEKIPGGYHLVSAGHCIQGAPADSHFYVADEIGGILRPVTVLKFFVGDVPSGTLTFGVSGSNLDFAELEFRTDRKYPIFVLGDEHDVHIGDRVINPNFAAGIGKQLSFGTVSSNLLAPTRRCPEEECSGVFMIQTFDTGGASGSAVVSARTHRVVGILVLGFEEPVGFGIEPISKFRVFLSIPGQTLTDENDKGPP